MMGIITDLYQLTHSYGVAIILLTIAIRLIIMPIYQRQMISMKKMAQLAPRIKEIQKKYKGDTQRINQAQMDLYREYKVNPLAGCLPMLIQLPFLWAIYAAIREFHFAGSFLWLPSLSVADPYFILPVLAAATTFWQTRIATPQTGTDKSQQMIMSILMPVFVGYWAWKFPAALSIYWVVSNFFAIAQQYLMVGSLAAPGGPPAAPKVEAKTR